MLCIALPVFLPLGTRLLIRGYEHELFTRAEDTPFVAGARGNRFDLTLDALYFRRTGLEPVPAAFLEELADGGRAVAIPLHLEFTARGHPLVGTAPEYYELRALRPMRGTLPLMIGDALLGADVAAELGLGPGDTLFSDPRELYDIAVPPALELNVAGVLAPAGGPDDGAVFVDVKTAWALAGLYHGHGDVTAELDGSLVLAETEDHVAVSPALIEHGRLTDENAASFHAHGDPAAMPLSAVLVVPASAKAATLIAARTNASKTYQMVRPRAVVEDLMAFVFRIRALLDTFAALLGASTVVMTVLVVLLSMRIRAAEMRTLHRIGCSRFATAQLYALEIGMIVGASLVLAGAGVGALQLLRPELAGLL